MTVADLLVYLCKEYALDIEFTGNILSIKKYNPPVPEIKEREIPVSFDPATGTISMDLKNDPLNKAFRKIMDATGQNLLFDNSMGNTPLNLYVNNVPLDQALEKLAAMNRLSYSKSRDGFHLFDALGDEMANNTGGTRRNNQRFGNNLNYEVLDTINRLLNVDFKNTPIASNHQ